jgi:hypothetical protein
MTHQGIVKGDAQQRLGSAGFIIGATLLVIGNLVMPYTTAPTTNIREMLTPLGEQAFRAEVASLLIAAGFWAMMIGVTGVYSSFTAGGAAWGRLGFYFLVVGTTLQTVSLSLDVATASAVANWLAASAEGREAAWSVVAALNALGRGVIPMTWIVYWLGFAFLGMAMVRSALYPRWLGWVGLILATPVVIVGIIHMFTARTTMITLVFVVLALFTNLTGAFVR